MDIQNKERDIRNEDKLIEFAKLLKSSKYTVVLTGAGMSTESGIPDFRSKDGLWRGIDPMKVACREALLNDYDIFYEFYKMRVNNLENCKPHIGYDILAKWEKVGLIKSIITQNVDDFHIIAGNKKVFRVHGSINEFSCVDCGKSATKDMFINKLKCHKCGSDLRPNVVLFGENLPEKELNSAIEEVQNSDLLIVIGTSLLVSPVNQLIHMTNGKKVYVNNDTSFSHYFDLTFSENVGELLHAVDRFHIQN
jgi:NAD-dependent deacetylase